MVFLPRLSLLNPIGVGQLCQLRGSEWAGPAPGASGTGDNKICKATTKTPVSHGYKAARTDDLMRVRSLTCHLLRYQVAQSF